MVDDLMRIASPDPWEGTTTHITPLSKINFIDQSSEPNTGCLTFSGLEYGELRRTYEAAWDLGVFICRRLVIAVSTFYLKLHVNRITIKKKRQDE